MSDLITRSAINVREKRLLNDIQTLFIKNDIRESDNSVSVKTKKVKDIDITVYCLLIRVDGRERKEGVIPKYFFSVSQYRIDVAV